MAVAGIRVYYNTATIMAVKPLEPTLVEPLTGLHYNGTLLVLPANVRLS
jgi:hypothetical protein